MLQVMGLQRVGYNLVTKQQQKRTYLQNRETHRLRKQTDGCQGEGTVRESGKVMYTLLYSKWITNRDLLLTHGTLLSVVCQPGWEGFGGQSIHVYVWLSPSAAHLKPPQHC